MQLGRNEPCPCGSGRKYKACCGRVVHEGASASDGRDRSADPEPSTEFARLFELLREQRFAELEKRARAFLAVDREIGLVWQLLGAALGAQGKDALEALTKAAELLKYDAPAHLNLGNALGRAGRLDEASASFERALAIHPDFAEAYNNLADIQLEQGKLEVAMANCREALRLRPYYAEAHCNLGKALSSCGRLDEAVRCLSLAAKIKPDFADAHNSLGSALFKLARVDDAIRSFQRALAIDGKFVEAHANLGNAWRSIGQLDDAVAGYRRALAIRPQFRQALTELATALRLQRRAADAEAACRQALELEPRSGATLAVLAELRADSGRFAEAEQLFTRATQVDPDCAEAWAGISRSRRMTAADVGWVESTRRLADGGIAPQRELLLRFALGKHLDDVGNFAAAFEEYRRANELAARCGPAHDRALLTRTVDLLIRSDAARSQYGAVPGAAESDRPVFIVGMLRSGTTLAEQILASHPAVHGAGELTFWGTKLAVPMRAALAIDAQQLDVPRARLAGWAQDYLDLQKRLAPDSLRVTDKLPTNFFLIGLIHAALPNARFIHMRRDPVDTCLSIYFQHLEAANTYANDLGDLAHYYGEYRRLMHHWRAALPSQTLLDVPYEGLVNDLPAWTRRMLDFLGLPWDARCADFHRTVRTVTTASKWQVRQTVSRASVERWRNYESFVGPLVPLREAN